MDKIKSFISEQYGENVLSLYAYGACTLRDTSPQYFLLVLKSGDIAPLRQHALKKKPFNDTVQFSIFTEKELNNAIDVFPIEFLEIQRSKKLLIGKDLLANMNIQLTHLRHECEYTLRSNILKLRAALLAPKANFSHLLSESLPLFLSSFDCIFTLKNTTPPLDLAKRIGALSTLTGVPLKAFETVITKPKIQLADFQVYIDALSQLTFYVNEL